MRSVVTHGALLVVVTLAALATWLSPEETDAGEATISIWNHNPDDVVEVALRSDQRTLLLERRTTDAQSYLWARETVRPPAVEAAEDGEAGDPADTTAVTAAETDADAGQDPPTETEEAEDAPAQAEEPEEPEERVEEFPVGTEGETVVERLAALQAVRDLGDATEERRANFGLADAVPTVTVRLRDGTSRELALGNSVVGGGNRYVLDVEGNRILVLPVGLLRPLEASEMLRLSEYQPFQPDEVASVTVHTRGSERSFERGTSGAQPQQPVWSPAGSDRPDPAFGSFMEQVNQLWIAQYVADAPADNLEMVLRIDYHDDRGNDIGFLELFRSPATDDDGQPTYLMRTGRTIVFGEIYLQLGERLEQDIESLFRNASGSTARPSAPVSPTRP